MKQSAVRLSMSVKKAKGGDKDAKAMLDVFNKIEPFLADGKPARMANLDEDEKNHP